MEHYFPVFNEFVPYKEIKETLENVEKLLGTTRSAQPAPRLTAYMTCKKILFARSRYLLGLFLGECQRDEMLVNMVREMPFVLTKQDNLLLVSQNSVSIVEDKVGTYLLTTTQNIQKQSIFKCLIKELEEEDQYLLDIYNALPRFGISNEAAFYYDLLCKDLRIIGAICSLMDNNQSSLEQALKHVIHINLEKINNVQINTERPSKKQRRIKKTCCVFQLWNSMLLPIVLLVFIGRR